MIRLINIKYSTKGTVQLIYHLHWLQSFTILYIEGKEGFCCTIQQAYTHTTGYNPGMCRHDTISHHLENLMIFTVTVYLSPTHMSHVLLRSELITMVPKTMAEEGNVFPWTHMETMLKLIEYLLLSTRSTYRYSNERSWPVMKGRMDK